jgi:predicted ATPase/DNA-binding SARP family transcriptional activator
MATLAYLAVTGQKHSRETLAALFWPENDHSSARAELRRTLSVLNRILGEGWLVTDRETVSLNIQDDPTRGSIFWLDVNEFQQQIQACETHDHPPTEACLDCIPHLVDAVELYMDDFMAGFSLPDSSAFDEWQYFQADDLRRQLASALERLATHYSAIFEVETAITYARRWLALDPIHEPAQRHLMVLYAQSGQKTAALRQYEAFHQLLQDELGVYPSEETQTLVEAIRHGAVLPIPREDEARKPEVLRSPLRTNLPIQAVPFVGREAELVELGELLTNPKVRLVTILGPGGVGKTRLAQEAAAAQLDNFDRGIFFVPLAHVDSVEWIVPTVADALGFSFYSGGEPRKQLLDFLREKNMLLLMDNYEHLLSGVDLTGEILAVAPGVKILATSRERLNLSGEYRYPLDGLSVPGDQTPETVMEYSAVRLFLESARRAQPDFELDEDNLPSVIQICHLVEGMPLAIRLAAVWVEMLSPSEIAQEIKRGHDFLSAGWCDMPERQRSMQAVFDHSWHLLSQEEREVFQGSSVFRGGCTREAAEAVTGASLHTLMALVNKSLISRDATGRYETHELSRHYAAAKLASDPEREMDIRSRHCAWFTKALQRWEVDRKGPRQVEALAKLVEDVDNIRASWDWAVTREQFGCLDQAINGLGWFFFWQSLFTELADSCYRAEQVLPQELAEVGPDCDSTQRPGNQERILAKILAWHGGANYYMGEQGNKLLEQSLKILECLEKIRDPDRNSLWDVREETAFTLGVLGGITLNTSGPKKARRFLEHSLELYREISDRWGLAYALSNLAWSISGSLLEEAEKLYEDSLGIFRTLEDGWGIAKCLGDMGTLAMMRGQHVKMKRSFEESHAIRKELGDKFGLGFDVQSIGVSDVHLGDFDRGLSSLNESLAISKDIGHPPFLFAHSKMYLSEANAHLGQYAKAYTCGQTALKIFREMSYQLGIGLCCYMLGLTALGEGKYGEAHQVLQEGAAIFKEIDNRESLGYALAISGYAMRGLGERHQASKCISEAMQIADGMGVFVPFIYSLPLAALLLADQGKIERAVELYALATRYGFVANSCWFDDMAGRELAALSATLPSSIVTLAQARGRELDWKETARVLLEELGELSWVGSE